MIARVGALLAVALIALGVIATLRPSTSDDTAAQVPIKHVVVLFLENHSFNEVLGYICVKDDRCEGTSTGVMGDGRRVDLRPGVDIVPGLRHSVEAQRKAINHGRMDGFSTIHGCTAERNYACFQQYRPYQIPNLAKLARTFTIQDHTFESDAVPTWGSHLELVAAQLDGFTGNNPEATPQHPNGPGWGCDSYRDAPWRESPISDVKWVPACIPDKQGKGPYRPSPVEYVPTIMTRMSANHLSWRIYRPPLTKSGPRLPYGWAICPTFAECLYGPQSKHVVADTQVIKDGKAGGLPGFSIVIPQGRVSQHNGWSMLKGDNWIASVVRAIMHGPDWRSTAIFITYDDCGCFYDEVPPPSGMGIRVPMVIVSPYAKPGYTDSTVASFAGILAFAERLFDLQPLSSADANAYDLFHSFDFTQKPLPPIKLRSHALPAAEVRWLKKHPRSVNSAET